MIKSGFSSISPSTFKTSPAINSQFSSPFCFAFSRAATTASSTISTPMTFFLQPVPSAARSYLCRCKDRKRYCPAFPLLYQAADIFPRCLIQHLCAAGVRLEKGKCRNSKFQSKQLFIKIIPAVQNFTAVALDRIRHGVVRNMQNSGEFSVQRKAKQSLFPAFQINFLLRCRYKRCKDFSRPGRPAHQQMPQISLMGIAMIKGCLFSSKYLMFPAKSSCNPHPRDDSHPPLRYHKSCLFMHPKC